MPRGIAIMILTAASLALAAPPPPKVVDTYSADSDPALPALPSGFSHAVASFAFSPDEQWIAVSLRARSRQAGSPPIPNSMLVLLPLHPASGQRVEINPGPRVVSALWSPDSESVAVQGNRGRGQNAPAIYNLRGELVWTGPPSGPLVGFIAPGRLLALHVKANGKFAGFDTIDTRTAAVTPWRAPQGRYAAIDSERGLLAMFPDLESPKTLVVDYATGKVVQSVENQAQATSICAADEFSICGGHTFVAPQVYFAENGRTLCEAAGIAAFESHPVCRDVDTGKTIAEFRGVEGGEPASASTRGPAWFCRNSTTCRATIAKPGTIVMRELRPTAAA